MNIRRETKFRRKMRQNPIFDTNSNTYILKETTMKTRIFGSNVNFGEVSFD